MTNEVNRGIGYTVQRIGDEVKVLLPYLDPMDPAMAKFRRPSVTFPADTSIAGNGTTLASLTDGEVITFVRGNIAAG